MDLNLIRNSARFTAGLARKKHFEILVQVTNRCNMKCSFCDFWPNGVAPKFELNPDDYRRLANELAEINSMIISVEGGEPLLRPDIVEIVSIFSEKHIPMLYTNGWFLDRQKAKDLFAAGVAQVGVSIDFPDAKRHDEKRGLAGAWQKAWETVEILAELAPRPRKQVHIMTVLMKDNQDDIEALLKLSAERGVAHRITLLSMEGNRRVQNDNESPRPDISLELMRLRKKYPHFSMFSEYLKMISPYLAGEEMPDCNAGRQGFNIDHLGNVGPCIEKSDLVVGNVRENSIQEIIKKLYAQQATKNCQDCFTLCRGSAQALGGGVRLRNMTEMGLRMRSI